VGTKYKFRFSGRDSFATSSRCTQHSVNSEELEPQRKNDKANEEVSLLVSGNVIIEVSSKEQSLFSNLLEH
jgi:hypothetical protein